MIAASALILLIAWAPLAGTPECALGSRALLAAYDVRVATAISADEVTALCEGLERLPPPLRRFPGGPLTFDWNAAPQPFGMGDGSGAHPEWRGGAHFELYDYAQTSDRRASWRLEELNEAERRSLWRERAVVHAVLQRWNNAFHFSDTPAWRRATGWLKPFDRPLTWRERPTNTFEGAYSRRRGMDSAALDFLTFAEELFVPAESVRSDALPTDDQVHCQEFSKTRALQELLGEVAPELRTAPAPHCPAFDRWANPERLSHFEVLFAAATGKAPESMFGHVLLRVVRREGAFVDSPDFGAVVQLVAVTGSDANGLRYVGRGLSGKYSLATVTSTFGDLVRETTEYEQRTVRRYRLKLSPIEERRLFERIWESERRGYSSYFFFTENCASALIALLNGVLEPPRHISRPGAFYVAPSAVLDEMTDFLEPIPDPILSSLDRAREATRARDDIVRSIASHRPDVARQLRDWQAVRLPGVKRLDSIAQGWLPTADAESRSLAYGYLRRTLEIERAAADLAMSKRLHTMIQAITPQAGDLDSPTALVAARQEEFERESVLERRPAALARDVGIVDALEHGPHRPYSANEQEILEKAREALDTFHEMSALAGSLVDAFFDATDPVQWDESAHADRVRRLAQAADHSIQSSGMGRLSLGAGAAYANRTVQPTVVLRTALIAEELGDQRAHGFRSDNEIRILDGEVALVPRLGWPIVERSDLTVLSYRSIARSAEPLREGWVDRFGWDMAIDWNHYAARPRPDEVRGSGELLAVLDESATWARLSVLGLGVEARGLMKLEQIAAFAGPRLSFTQRLPLTGAHALRFDASVSPGFDPIAKRWSTEFAGDLRVDLVAGRGLVLSPIAATLVDGSFHEIHAGLMFEFL